MPLKRIKYSSETLKASKAPAFPNKPSKALELPCELLMEILSYFGRPIQVNTKTNYSPRWESAHSLVRTDVLRALSQTCKLWRNLFLPLLWERLEPSLTHSTSNAWYKVYGESLIRQSSLVNEVPEIASLVQTMSFNLTRYSTATVLPACGRAIEALPNLRTLHITRIHHKMSTALKSAFGGHVFPQVRTIALPVHAHLILRCCPEVRKVVCFSRQDSRSLVSAIAMGCKKVEEVEGFRGPEFVMKKLVAAAPNLRSIKFDDPIPLSHLRHFSSLKKLAHITLYTIHDLEENAMADNEFVSCLKLAKDIVRKFGRQGSVTGEFYNQSGFGSTFLDWSRAFNVSDVA